MVLSGFASISIDNSYLPFDSDQSAESGVNFNPDYKSDEKDSTLTEGSGGADTGINAFGSSVSLDNAQFDQDGIDVNAEYVGETVRADYKAKNSTVKSIDYIYHETFGEVETRNKFDSGTAGGIDVAPDGTIYVGSWLSTTTLGAYYPNGTLKTSWSVTSGVKDLEVDAAGNILVLGGGVTIYKYTSTGSLITSWNETTTGESWNDPYSITTDADRNVFMLDRLAARIYKWDKDGNFLSKVGCGPSPAIVSCGGGEDGFMYQARGIDAGPDGRIYVANQLYGYLTVFPNGLNTSTEDNYLGCSSGLCMGAITDVSVTNEGLVYVANRDLDRIAVYDLNGIYQNIRFGSSSWFTQIEKMTVEEDGSVWITEWATNDYYYWDFIRTDLTPTQEDLDGITKIDDGKVYTNLIDRNTTWWQEYLYVGVTFFDMVNPTSVSVSLDWEVENGGNFTQIFDDNVVTADITDSAIYGAGELQAEVKLWWSTYDFYTYLSVFDTGIEDTSTGTNSTTFQSFESSLIYIDYIWAISQETEQTLRPVYRYSTSGQKTHTMTVDVYDYRIPIAIYAPISWNLTNIIPTANYIWDNSSRYWLITNTLPTIYTVIFQSGDGFGIDSAETKRVGGLKEIGSDYSDNNFEDTENYSWTNGTEALITDHFSFEEDYEGWYWDSEHPSGLAQRNDTAAHDGDWSVLGYKPTNTGGGTANDFCYDVTGMDPINEFQSISFWWNGTDTRSIIQMKGYWNNGVTGGTYEIERFSYNNVGWINTWRQFSDDFAGFDPSKVPLTDICFVDIGLGFEHEHIDDITIVRLPSAVDDLRFDNVTTSQDQIFDGLNSLHLYDTDPYADYLVNDFNLPTGNYYLSFATYAVSMATDYPVNLYLANRTGSLIEYPITYTLNRWQQHFFYFETVTDLVYQIRFGTGGATSQTIDMYLDHIEIFEANSVITPQDHDTFLIEAQAIHWDGRRNPGVFKTDVSWTFYDTSDKTNLVQETLTSDTGGVVSYTYNGRLRTKGYASTLEHAGSSIQNQTTYLTPMLGPDYAISSMDHTFDFELNTLTNLDADTEAVTNETLVVTSNDPDYWAFYDTNTMTTAYAVTARIKHTGGTDDYFGISFYDIPSASSASDDVFFLRAGTSQSVFRLAGSETNPVAISSTGEWYEIRAEVTTDSVTIYVNDTFVDSRVNVNSLSGGYFGVYGLDSNVQVDFVRVTAITQPILTTATTYTLMSSTNNTVSHSLFIDEEFGQVVNDLDVFDLNLAGSDHNITYLPIYNSQSDADFYVASYIHAQSYVYDPSSLLSVSVEQVIIGNSKVTVFLTATLDGSYVVYENNTAIATALFDKDGTSIITDKNTTLGIFMEYAVKFTAGVSTVWYNTTYSNDVTFIEDRNIYIRYQDGIGNNIPFESFNAYYRFDSEPYQALGRDVIQFPYTVTNFNIYLNDSFGVTVANETTTFTDFFTVTINAHEIFLSNRVNQSLLVQVKIPALSWSESVGYWVALNSFRMFTIFNGTYDYRVLADDGLTVLQTSTLEATRDLPLVLSEEDDLILYDYDWRVDDGNVTVNVLTNYGDAAVDVWDNGNFVGTFYENETISWNMLTTVNASQVFIYVKYNVSKYSALEEQQILRAFTYYVNPEDFNILVSDISFFETIQWVNITVESNQVATDVNIWHDDALVYWGDNDIQYNITKSLIAGSHNITVAVIWFNSTGYQFVDWYILDYWVASYYFASLDVIPNSDGLKLVSNQINFMSFNVYVEGELVNPVIPDPFVEQETDEINVTLIAEGRLWIRNTRYNLTLEIKDKWDMLIYSSQIDISTFEYRVIELPLVYLTITSTRTTNTEIQMYRWNDTTEAYQLGPSISVPANASTNPVWVIGGLYTVRVWDVENDIELVNNQRVAVPIYTEDTSIGEGYPINIGDRQYYDNGTESDIVTTPWNILNLTPGTFDYGEAESGGSTTTGASGLNFLDEFIFNVMDFIATKPLETAFIFAGILALIAIAVWLRQRTKEFFDPESAQKKPPKPPADSEQEVSTGLRNVSQRDKRTPAMQQVSRRKEPRPKQTNGGSGITPISSRNRAGRTNQLTNVVDRLKADNKAKKKKRRKQP